MTAQVTKMSMLVLILFCVSCEQDDSAYWCNHAQEALASIEACRQDVGCLLNRSDYDFEHRMMSQVKKSCADIGESTTG